MAVGETVHLAARLQALAAPDTVVVSDATHAQTSLLFEMEDLGPVELKGFSTATGLARAPGDRAFRPVGGAVRRHAGTDRGA